MGRREVVGARPAEAEGTGGPGSREGLGIAWEDDVDG